MSLKITLPSEGYVMRKYLPVQATKGKEEENDECD
jgi:hypothetical protein